jgi:hypothetical protein
MAIRSSVILMALICYAVLLGVAQAGPPSPYPQLVAEVNALQSQVATLRSRVSSLQSTVGSLQSALSTVQENHALLLGPYVTVDSNTQNGLKGPHLIFHGVNVHIESGSGTTVDSTGLGNLLIGYDSDSTNDGGMPFNGCTSAVDTNRTGSHNLIVGDCHQFTASGGLLGGFLNTVSGKFASISSGSNNIASGLEASVSGGAGNTASGMGSSVSGGLRNTASGPGVDSSVSGGEVNTASGSGSWVGGGEDNDASGASAVVIGGNSNSATSTDQIKPDGLSF